MIVLVMMIMIMIMIITMTIMMIKIMIIIMKMIIPPAGLLTVTGLPGPPVQSSPIPFSHAV